jgi:hypothetical protein
VDLEQGPLDLRRLDAVAADLDLSVHASQVKETAVGQDAPEIAGAVDAFRTAGGVREELHARIALGSPAAARSHRDERQLGWVRDQARGSAKRAKCSTALGVKGDDAVRVAVVEHTTIRLATFSIHAIL